MSLHVSTRRATLLGILTFSVVLLLVGVAGNARAQDSVSQPDIGQIVAGQPVRPGILVGSIASLPKAPGWRPGVPIREVPLGMAGPPRAPLAPQGAPEAVPGAPDGAWQSLLPSAVTPPEFQNANPNFNGIGFTGSVPPDTNGAIGRNHYIQSVNAQFAIYNRQGALLAGPTAINQLWISANSGTQCQTRNDGDPVVLYDRFADRWVISQFAIPNGFGTPPTFQCVAVSRTNDPVNGGWYLYEFQFTFAHDYPKLSVWPDAYYMTSQRGFSGGSLNIVAFDRADMLNGNPATFQAATLGSPAVVLLPSDADWSPPPAGSPAFFARMMDGGLWGGNDRVEIYQFQVDWGNPANSSFTGPTTLTPAPFDSGLCAPGSLNEYCIPQPGLPASQNVAAITVWPMFRLQYHNFGSYEAMVFNHTVDADGNGNAGIRWYELRRSPVGSGAWTIYQQGTFAPQQPGAPAWLHRWMGSIAMDRAGDIALGYSVSDSNATFPGVRYAGRLATDPLGLLPQGEATLFDGTGSQNLFCGNPATPCPRWGDYSDMTLDPVDGCTFWYTQEYGNAGQSWSTRIGAFRFPTCNPADVAITKVDAPDPVNAGDLLTYSITVTNNGPNGATNVVVTDPLPASVTYVADTGGCTNLAGTLSCALGDLAPGASRAFDVQVRVSASLIAGGTNTLSNTATVSATELDPDTSNNSATATTIVTELADLRVSKDCKPDQPVQPGVEAVCTIVVENLGPSTARSVTVVDNHVSNGTFNFGTITPGTCSATPNPQNGSGTVTCNLGDLAAGSSVTIQVPVSASEPQDINDQVTVSSPTPDPDPANNQAADHVTVSGASDLAITKTDTPDPVVAGTDLTYDLQVTNGGPSTAVNVLVEDMLPAGVTIVSVSSVGGTCNAGEPGNAAKPTTCAFDSLNVSASATMQIVVTVLPGTTGILHNDARASSDNFDPNNSNNLASTDTTVQGEADLSITKADNPDPVIAGQKLTYEVTISNGGPSTARTVTLLDQLPAEVTFVSATISNGTGTCVLQNVPPNSVFCNLSDLDPGQYVKVFIETLVKPDTAQGVSISNSATAGSATTDPNGANNTATEGTTVNTSADLLITKDARLDYTNPSQRIVYTLVVTNLGPSDAQKVTLTDPLPLTAKKLPFLYYNGVGPAAGQCAYTLDTHTFACSFGTIAAGDSRTVDVWLDARGSVGNIINIATTTSTTSDPNSANNSARKDLKIKGGPGKG